MKRLQVEKLYEAYSTAYDAIPPEAMELDFRVTIRTMQALAEGQPVAVERLAEDWDMPLEQVRTILEQGEAIGSAQLDSDGNLVGGVLSLIPTHHRIQVSGNVLYAWCAYDAIEAPGILGKTTQIESTDPITSETIRLTITPDGVADYYPESTLVSVVSPEVGGAGPESPRCSQMLFFTSRKSAEIWIKDHPNVVIVTVEEAFQIVNEFVIKPARQMGLVD